MAWKFWTTSRCQTSSNLNNTLACAMQLGEDYKHRSYHSFEKSGCLITAGGSEDSKILKILYQEWHVGLITWYKTLDKYRIAFDDVTEE